MNALATLLRKLTFLASTVVAWAGVCGAALAEEAGGGGGGGGGGAGARAYAVPYFVVALTLGLALLFVCRSTRRRDRPRGEEYDAMTSADFGKAEAVPVITVGMRLDQVNKLLGKPSIARRGEDIYRELAQAGKLSEEEAAKEYLIYQHKAGRYELVALEKRVIEIKTQPKRDEG